ncbi:MAG TPA: universal stress protein [Ramlibacter sp.]|nr:universal stress protein [Ramlibacter sp.]
MESLLVPVDADCPERTRSAIAQAISLSRTAGTKVHLLSIQPAVSGHVAMFFAESELRAFQQEAGEEELAPARAQLEAAGIQSATHIRVGHRAQTIARAAHELGCKTIVMGQDGTAPFASRLFGSVTGQVRQLVATAGGCQVLGS